MCYPCGILDKTVNDCPMCKVFPHSRCPHKKDICRNRNAHPRFDVMFLKNAEVESFNGCGFCKWAEFFPQKKESQNRGWPGCCRAPSQSEYQYITIPDWKAVSTIYNIPIPPHVKATLDKYAMPSINIGRRSSPSPLVPVNSSKSSSPTSSNVGSSKGSSSSSRASTLSSSSASPIREKGVSVSGLKGTKGSPKAHVAVLAVSLATSNAFRNGSGTLPISSSPTASIPNTVDASQHGHSRYRQPIPDFGDREKKGDAVGLKSSSPSNSSKNLELEVSATPKRISSVRRSNNVLAPKASEGTASRRSTISSASSSSSKVSSPAIPVRSMTALTLSNRSTVEQTQATNDAVKTSRRKEEEFSSGSSSSGSSDDIRGGSGSLSDSTVTSDGGFTDYLSDESEAELQRQAEAKAALLAQNQIEEMEFKAARQRLANVDLRPPKTWNPMNMVTMLK